MLLLGAIYRHITVLKQAVLGQIKSLSRHEYSASIDVDLKRSQYEQVLKEWVYSFVGLFGQSEKKKLSFLLP